MSPSSTLDSTNAMQDSIVRYVLTLPLNFVPVVGTAFFLGYVGSFEQFLIPADEAVSTVTKLDQATMPDTSSLKATTRKSEMPPSQKGEVPTLRTFHYFTLGS